MIKEDQVPVLGDTTYNMNVLDAPVATGLKLRVISWILVHSPLGPSLRKLLLKNNNMHYLRALSSQVPASSKPPLTHPINRHPAADIARKAKAMSIHPEGLFKSFSIEQESNEAATEFSSSFPRRTVRQFHSHYKSGGKVVDVMKRTIKSASHLLTLSFGKSAIEKWKKDHSLNIFSAMLPEEIVKAAQESDARYAAGEPISVLDGVPVAVKDMIHIKGHLNYNGKSPLDIHSAGHEMPSEDDTMVRRLREAGAIIFGGTVMTEGGVTPLGWSAHFQGPYNVYNFDRYCGGSSSGSAVAVASGLMPLAIGFDGGGSIRIPASMSGVHGLGVTFGRIPFDVGLDTTMIKPGPLAATAEDAAFMYSIHGPPTAHISNFNDIDDLGDVKIGYFKEWIDDSDLEVRDKIYEVMDYLKAKGVTFIGIRIPHLQELSLSHAAKIATEFAMKFDTVLSNRPDSMEPNTKITVGLGSTMSSLEVISADHLRAWAFDYVNNLMEREGLHSIISPTIPMLPPFLSDFAKTDGENNTPLVVRMLKYVFLGNYLGLPAYSVPVGYATPENPETGRTGSGKPVPIGLQLMARHWDEEHLLRMAHALEVGFVGKNVQIPSVFFDPLSQG
eukprot:GSChrysophyteH2.ASY1.ANO1.150.1 assembled CDS